MGPIPLKVNLLPTTNLSELSCIPLTSKMPSRGTLTGLRSGLLRTSWNTIKCKVLQLDWDNHPYQYRLGDEARATSPVEKDFQWIKTPGCNLHPRKPTVHRVTPKRPEEQMEGDDFPISPSPPRWDPTWRTASSSGGLNTGKRGRLWSQAERAGVV